MANDLGVRILGGQTRLPTSLLSERRTLHPPHMHGSRGRVCGSPARLPCSTSGTYLTTIIHSQHSKGRGPGFALAADGPRTSLQAQDGFARFATSSPLVSAHGRRVNASRILERHDVCLITDCCSLRTHLAMRFEQRRAQASREPFFSAQPPALPDACLCPAAIKCNSGSADALLYLHLRQRSSTPRASAHHLTMRSAFPPPALSIHIPNKQSSQM